MKVLFLDIDGVLNSTCWNEAHQGELRNGEFIDEGCVRLLSRVIKSTKALVVMHSGWRFWFNENLQPTCLEADKLLSMLKKYEIEFYDKTPDISTEEIRKTKKFSLVKAREIMEWLRKHHEVTNYLVLDDLDLHNEKLAHHQIQTNSAVGLTEQEAELAIKMLNKSES